jgi:hypothetical protein
MWSLRQVSSSQTRTPALIRRLEMSTTCIAGRSNS